MTDAQQPDRTLKWEPHWITPPEVYEPLNAEFHFDYDPCPFPKPKDYNGITADWGKSNYVNPPFHRENGIGPTAFVRKAIEENKKGKTVVLTIPTQSYVNLLIEAGAEVRSLGRVKWLHTVTREPMKGPSPITAFILRSRPAPSPESQDTIKIPQHAINKFFNKIIESERKDAAAKAREEVLDKLAARLKQRFRQGEARCPYAAIMCDDSTLDCSECIVDREIATIKREAQP
jgi:hypothetical protein